MVEVFKTNVLQKHKSRVLLFELYKSFPGHKINFDLADCDKILRVEGNSIPLKRIIRLLNVNGYSCEVLS